MMMIFGEIDVDWCWLKSEFVVVIMIFFDFCSDLSSYLSRGSSLGGDEIDVVELMLRIELE